MIRFLPFAAGLALAACQTPQPSGAHLYARHCAECHGSSLDGNGPLASELPVAPPDLTGLASVRDGVFPTAYVIEQIHGYPGRYHGGLMPEFAAELSSAESNWTTPDGEQYIVPRTILRLAQYIETQQK